MIFGGISPLGWVKVAAGAALLAMLVQFGWMVRSTIIKAASADQLIEDLENQRKGTEALAERYALETKRRWELEQREREIMGARDQAQREARTQHERISREIMEALASDACAAVHAPVDAVDGVRRAIARANGSQGDPGRPLRSDSLRLD